MQEKKLRLATVFSMLLLSVSSGAAVWSTAFAAGGGSSSGDAEILEAFEEMGGGHEIDGEGIDTEGGAGEIGSEDGEAKDTAVEVTVPIYNYDIVNVAAPARFAVALNPYGLPVQMGNGEVCTNQVVSRNYGIVNKSSTDRIVTVTLLVEDLNEDKISFVDSAEEVKMADEDEYAVYLAAVPADSGGIRIGGESADKDTMADALSDVSMTGADGQAVALHDGENQIAFKLSKAVYGFEDGEGILLDDAGSGEEEEQLVLSDLAPGEAGATGFTFDGAMNQKADWSRLLKGIRITAVYAYEAVDGDEKVVDGTGAMVDLHGTSQELEALY